MAMIQTFFLGILLFFQSILAPLVYNIPTGPVDYGGGFDYKQAEIADPLYLFKDGETAYFLVTPDEAVPTIETGVKWIQEFIELMTGKTFARKTASQVEAGDRYIAIGLPALGGFEAEAAALGNEDFIKRAVDGNIFISGNGLGAGRGTMYGCAAFVENQLGCRWFTPTLKVAPEAKDVIIDAKLDDTQKALLDYRDNYFPYMYLYPEFKAFHKSNSSMGSYIDKDGNNIHMTEELGRAMEYFSVGLPGAVFPEAAPPDARYNHYGGFCHAMHNLIPRSLFYGDYYNHVIGEQKQDQELFAFRKEKNARVVGQRCLTNPKVFELTKLAVFACIEAHIDDLNFKWVSVEHEDNGDYCQCPACEASDARLGGLSGTNVWFANKIARAVAEEFPQRPDIHISTFAYSYTTAPPTVTVPGPDGNIPEGNVSIRMCSIDCCFNHPIRDCGGNHDGIFANMTPKPSVFAQYMIDWGKLCDVNGAEITIWDYNTCFKFYPAIYPNLHVLADNLQLFVENNARGVFSEGYDTGGVEVLSGSASGEFGELRAYMLAKLLWNPYLNSNQIMDEFMDAYYGAAAKPYILEFIDFYTNKAIGTNHTGVFGRPEEFTYMNAFECKKMDALFDKAEALASNDEQLLHIRQSRLSLKLYEANMMLGDYSWFNPCRLQNNKDLFYECVLLGLDRFSSFMVEPYNTYVWLHRPYDWAKMKSWIDFVDESKVVPMDLETYRAAHTL